MLVGGYRPRNAPGRAMVNDTEKVSWRSTLAPCTVGLSGNPLSDRAQQVACFCELATARGVLYKTRSASADFASCLLAAELGGDTTRASLRTLSTSGSPRRSLFLHVFRNGNQVMETQ